MINYYGDPVLSYGNQDATVEAFKKLDFLVTIDAFMCNTAVLSDVVLPESTYSEQTQMKADWLYDAFIAYYAQVVKPMYDTKPTAWIFMELAKRMGREMYFPWVDIEDAYKNQLAGTPWSFDELKEKGFIITDPHEFYKYKRWNGLNPPDGYGSSGKTKTGKYNFVNPVAEESGIDPLPDYKDPKQEMPELAPDEDHPLILGYFRVLEHEHSSTFNNIALMRLCGRNPLWINVLDARKRGIESGTIVEVASPYGNLTYARSRNLVYPSRSCGSDRRVWPLERFGRRPQVSGIQRGQRFWNRKAQFSRKIRGNELSKIYQGSGFEEDLKRDLLLRLAPPPTSLRWWGPSCMIPLTQISTLHDGGPGRFDGHMSLVIKDIRVAAREE